MYEERAEEWRDRRGPALPRPACDRSPRPTPPGTVSADLGCGAGLHLPYLARPVGGARRRPRHGGPRPRRGPRRWPVQADLEALPFRGGALGAGWARASYLHLPNDGCRLRSPTCTGHRGRGAGAPRVARGRRPAASSPTTTSRAGTSRAGPWTRWPTCSVGAGFAIDSLTIDDGNPFWVQARVTRARTLPGHRRPRHAAPRVRPEPVGLRRRRRHRVRPARQPLLARGARGRHRDRRPRPAGRADWTRQSA